MAPPLLLLQDVNLTFGTAPLLSGAGLGVSAGDRICLVGRNGSGKSTLLKIAAGSVQADSGRRFAQPGATIRYLPQEPDFEGFATTLAYVEAGFDGAATNHHRALYLLEQLGLSGTEDPTTLSGGEARRTALARVLAPEPDVLLLDEPTNHLDLPGIEWLEKELNSLRSGIILISHDRRLLERVSRATLWLDRGITRQLDQGFAHFEPWRDAVLEQEETDRHKLGRKIVMEEDWLRYGVTARRKRNQKRLADLHSLRKKHREQRGAQGKVRMEAAEADLSGRLVMVAEGVSKSYGNRPIVRDFSARVIRGDRVGIVGPNGAGKTTLLRALAGLQGIIAGSIQIMDLPLTPENPDPLQYIGFTPDTPPAYEMLTVRPFLEFIARGYHLPAVEARERIDFWLEKVWLTEKSEQKIKGLSRGMRQRLGIARTLLANPTVILLDEPAAGLDPAGRVQFRQLLADLRDQGKALIVSSHILSDMAEYCTHIGIMSGGRMHHYGTVDHVTGTAAGSNGDGRCRYTVTLLDPPADALQLLSRIAGVDEVSLERDRVTLTYWTDRARAAALLKQLLAADLVVAGFSANAPDLEEAYLRTGIKQVD